jgi:flagellar motor switch protein FliN
MAEAMNQGRGGTSRLFAEFTERLALGLQTRIDGECAVADPEAEPVRSDQIGGRLADGALVARTAWTVDGHDGSGCFLWLGDFGALLGGGDRPAAGLSAAELETLGQSLRINVHEGGDDDPVLQWTDPELVPATGLANALREAGIPTETEGIRHVVHLGEDRLTFVFLEAPSAEGSAVNPAEASPAEASPAATSPAAANPAAADPAAMKPTEAVGSARPEPVEAAATDAAFLGGILDLPLSLQIRLGTTQMALDELLHLIPGSVIELQQREEEPLEVLANGRVVARGEVVVVDERFGVRITEIVASRERLAAV